VDARTEAAKRPFDHVVRIRDTSFQLQTTLGTPAPSIQDVLKELVDDEARNDLIFDDVLCALEAGRSPVVITERTAHLETIAKRLERFARHVVVLRGGQSTKYVQHPLGNTKTPKPFSSLHQMVNCFARGTAASTTDFVSLGIRQPWKNSPKTHHGIEGGGR
jgi:hypothetical protein